ncbi:MAG TPA: gamma-glutamylcyclotransferase [Aestuariivirgaceae bacterium]|jgi:cation transport protein ChaC
MDRFWIFAYGSLMWRPGFHYEERREAVLSGLHRSLCVYSHVHRGTPERPGLVMGLDHGGACRGVAFRILAENWTQTIKYLRAREQVTHVYKEARRRIRLEGDGRSVSAVTFVVDRRHPQYAGKLSLESQLAHVLQGEGRSGRNPEYVLNTADHLTELGLHDPTLHWLANKIRSDKS